MPLFQWGKFTYGPGIDFDYQIDCSTLAKDDWICAANMMHAVMGGFRYVLGVNPGGLKLAEYLQGYCSSNERNILVVDDVYTTYEAMEEAKLKARDLYKSIEMVWPENNAIWGCVLFSRGATRGWIVPIFTLHGSLRTEMIQKPRSVAQHVFYGPGSFRG